MTKTKKKPKPLFFLLIFLVLVVSGSFLFLCYEITPVGNSNETIEVVIPNNTSVKGIAEILKEKKLIRNQYVFCGYVKVHHKTLKASTYQMKQSMSLSEIVTMLSDGNTYNENNIKITFKEGLRITDYAKEIEEKTSHSYQEVISLMKDKTYIQTLISKYWFLTEDILQNGIYYPLEGYLAPNTYEFAHKDVEIKEIIETMLDQEEKELKSFKNYSSNIHTLITMASIVQLEGANDKDRKMIVGVFENRLKANMNLGSDVTTYYGLQKSMKVALTSEEFNKANPYNTRHSQMGGKMPIGPICNPSIECIEDARYPTENEYYFFIADKNGKVYYTKTHEEHSRLKTELRNKGDLLW